MTARHPLAFAARGTKQTAVDIFGLILDGAENTVGQRLTFTPGDTSVGRAGEPAGPVTHLGAYLEEQQ